MGNGWKAWGRGVKEGKGGKRPGTGQIGGNKHVNNFQHKEKNS